MEKQKIPLFEGDLLILIPPFDRKIVSIENIGVEYIAAATRAAGYSTAIINAGLHGLEDEDILAVLKNSRFKVLAISTIHYTLVSGLYIAKEIKKVHPDCHILLGGIEAALKASRLIDRCEYIESIGIGEGEELTTELLDFLSAGRDLEGINGLVYRKNGKVQSNPQRRLIQSLDDLPFPVRDDMQAVIDLGGPVVISTSRGCFGKCTFCSVRAFYDLSIGKPWRGRSPQSVVKEIAGIVDTYGINLFSFIDETIHGPGKQGEDRLMELATCIHEANLKIKFFATIRADQIERKVMRELKQVGLCKLEVGIESMARTQLSRYGKTAKTEDNRKALEILDDEGILCEEYMIPFDPDMSMEELQINKRFYRARFEKKEKDQRYGVSPLTMGDYLYPYPGTGIYERYKELKHLGKYFYTPFYSPDEQLTLIQRILHKMIYFINPAFPMSYTGIGNLWVNSRDLPKETYVRLNEISARFGILLVEFLDYLISLTGENREQRVSADRIREGLSPFLTKAAQLKEQIRQIIEKFATDGDSSQPQAGDAFFAQLYLYGYDLKKVIINKMYYEPEDEEGLVQFITSCLEGKEV